MAIANAVFACKTKRLSRLGDLPPEGLPCFGSQRSARASPHLCDPKSLGGLLEALQTVVVSQFELLISCPGHAGPTTASRLKARGREAWSDAAAHAGRSATQPSSCGPHEKPRCTDLLNQRRAVPAVAAQGAL